MPTDRRAERRGRFALLWDPLFKGLRASRRRASSFGAALGIFLVAGMLVAVTATSAFVAIANWVRGGRTQAFDEAILRWIGARHTKLLDVFMLEVTALGTGAVVLALVGVAGMFLWLTRHKYSALLLLVSTFGGVLLNNILKLGFARPRPQVFEWEVHAASSSFPSGHAMSAAVVYGTVAYLAARLQRRRWAQWLTLTVAAVLIVLICVSRLYLGVHYPSDVLAGVIVGLAWAAFCMATLETLQKFALRNAPRVLAQEEAAPLHTSTTPAAASSPEALGRR